MFKQKPIIPKDYKVSTKYVLYYSIDGIAFHSEHETLLQAHRELLFLQNNNDCYECSIVEFDTYAYPQVLPEDL